MAAPNLMAATTLTEGSAGLAVTTSAATLVANAAASGKVIRVKSVIFSNIHATNTGTVTLQVLKNGASTFRVAYQISVAIGTSFVPVSVENIVHLEENDTLQALANAATTFEALASYDTVG